MRKYRKAGNPILMEPNDIQELLVEEHGKNILIRVHGDGRIESEHLDTELVLNRAQSTANSILEMK